MVASPRPNDYLFTMDWILETTTQVEEEMSLKQTATVSEQRRLSVQLSARTLTNIQDYAAIKVRRDELDLEMNLLKNEIEERFNRYDPEALEAGVELEGGYGVKKVRGTYKEFQPRVALKYGVPLEELFLVKDKSPHIRITLPKRDGETDGTS